jgi:hypothetical protein
MLEKGIYEELINLWLKGEIENYKSYKISTDKVDSDSSSRLLSIYVAEKMERALDYMKDNNTNLSLRVKFVNELLETINSRSGVKVCSEIINPPEMLLSVGDNFYKSIYQKESQ